MQCWPASWHVLRTSCFCDAGATGPKGRLLHILAPHERLRPRQAARHGFQAGELAMKAPLDLGHVCKAAGHTNLCGNSKRRLEIFHAST